MQTRPDSREAVIAPRRGALTFVTIVSVGAILMLLFAASGAVVSESGILNVSSRALGVVTLVLSGAGLSALVRMYGDVRRASTCARSSC